MPWLSFPLIYAHFTGHALSSIDPIRGQSPCKVCRPSLLFFGGPKCLGPLDAAPMHHRAIKSGTHTHYTDGGVCAFGKYMMPLLRLRYFTLLYLFPPGTIDASVNRRLTRTIGAVENVSAGCWAFCGVSPY